MKNKVEEKKTKKYFSLLIEITGKGMEVKQKSNGMPLHTVIYALERTKYELLDAEDKHFKGDMKLNEK